MPEVQPKIVQALNRSVDVMLQDIQQHVPVRTGRLRASYETTDATRGDLRAGVGSDLDYAPFHYPNPEQSKRPSLFSSKPGLFGGSGRSLETVVETELEKSLSSV